MHGRGVMMGCIRLRTTGACPEAEAGVMVSCEYVLLLSLARTVSEKVSTMLEEALIPVAPASGTVLDTVWNEARSQGSKQGKREGQLRGRHWGHTGTTLGPY